MVGLLLGAFKRCAQSEVGQANQTYKDLPTSARATYDSEYYASPSAPTLPIPGQHGYAPPADPPVHLLYEPPEFSVKPRPKVPYTTEWRLKSITNTKSVEYTVEELEEQFRQLMTEAELAIKYHLLLESDDAASEEKKIARFQSLDGCKNGDLLRLRMLHQTKCLRLLFSLLLILRLSPVPLYHTSLPYLTAKEHQLINHLQLCPSMPHQHTIPPSLWLGPDSSIRISLDRVCPRLPPANNNKLKGKKIYRSPMPAPSKICIKSFPDMTHSRVQKKMHNTDFLESDTEKYYHQFMHECTKGASTSGIPIAEKGKILIIKGKSKVRPCSLVHFSDTSIAFTRKKPRPILGPETSIIYLILGDHIPSKERFEPPSREPSPPPVPESDLQVVASDTPQPMVVMLIATSEPTSTFVAPAPADFVTGVEFKELKALIHSRLPPAPAPAPLPPPPPPPAADTVSRTEFLAFQNQISSEFQGLLAFLKQNLPPSPSPPHE
ncbi:hypothetical protein Fmac_018193 [Flemingia macrophylla]|uniref:Uncharacterized protein n=1 Tax=Flemingia macrophylla TaxID=520843 RepID=A0ABD1M494_9FABA